MSEQIPSQSDNSPDLLGDILGKILSPQPQTARETATAENITSGTGGVTGAINSQNSVGDIFSSLLSNPEMLAKLPSIISAAKPIIDMFSQSQKSSSSATSDSVATGALISGSDNKSAPARTLGRESECRNALLCAMKPYLSSDRQNTIDYIVKLSRLGDILKTL